MNTVLANCQIEENNMMAKSGWLQDQLLEVRKDLDKWDKSRLDAMRREVNAVGNRVSLSSNRPSSSENSYRQKAGR